MALRARLMQFRIMETEKLNSTLSHCPAACLTCKCGRSHQLIHEAERLISTSVTACKRLAPLRYLNCSFEAALWRVNAVRVIFCDHRVLWSVNVNGLASVSVVVSRLRRCSWCWCGVRRHVGHWKAVEVARVIEQTRLHVLPATPTHTPRAVACLKKENAHLLKRSASISNRTVDSYLFDLWSLLFLGELRLFRVFRLVVLLCHIAVVNARSLLDWLVSVLGAFAAAPSIHLLIHLLLADATQTFEWWRQTVNTVANFCFVVFQDWQCVAGEMLVIIERVISLLALSFLPLSLLLRHFQSETRLSHYFSSNRACRRLIADEYYLSLAQVYQFTDFDLLLESSYKCARSACTHFTYRELVVPACC